MPFGTYSAKPRRSSRNSSVTGAGEKPQLPTTSVVTPWRIFDSARRFAQSRQSECECSSMMPTSARRAGPPVPSSTWPPSSLRSSTGRVLEAEHLFHPGGGGEEARFGELACDELHGQ